MTTWVEEIDHEPNGPEIHFFFFLSWNLNLHRLKVNRGGTRLIGEGQVSASHQQVNNYEAIGSGTVSLFIGSRTSHGTGRPFIGSLLLHDKLIVASLMAAGPPTLFQQDTKQKSLTSAP